jgi:hypothetical protein
VKQSWEDPQRQAPIPHAELLTLSELAAEAGVSVTTAVQRLEARGFTAVSPDIMAAMLATSNQVSAQQIYEIIRSGSGSSLSRSQGNHREGGGGGRGGGVGWKTLTEYCAETGMALQEAMTRLQAENVVATPDQTLREIAQQNGFDRPYELLDLLQGPSATEEK